MGTPNPVISYSTSQAIAAAREEFSPRELAVLDSINQKVAASESIERLIDFLFEAARAISPCDRLGIGFITEDGSRLTSRYARTSYERQHLRRGYSEDLQGSTLQRVLEDGGVRVISDLPAYLALKPESSSTELIVREGMRSSMTCPLTVDGRKIAILFRNSEQTNAFDRHQVHLHLAVAERLGQAVEKAYRIEELENAVHAYYEMLGFVSHELKSPLASMVLDGSVLLKGYLGELSAPHHERIERMVAKAEYLLGLTREYLDLTRIESGRLDPIFKPDVDMVRNVIEPAMGIVATLSETQKNRIVTKFPARSIFVMADRELLRIVMVNLLSNAVKYSHEGGEIRIEAAESAGIVRVTVWNEGPGFPEEEKCRLFRKFSRLQTPDLLSKKGTGVGLYTAWRIIQIHQGKIKAESEQGKWASFTLELPAVQLDSDVRRC